MNVREIADTRLDRAVHVADDTARPTDRSDLHGSIQAAGFGGVKRDDLSGPLLNDLDGIVGRPGALVRHDRRINGACDFRHSVDPLDGLLKIFDRTRLDAAVNPDRFGWSSIALVCVDAEVDRGPHCIANAPYHGDIALSVHPHLDLDGTDALGRDLGRLDFCFFDAD